MSEAVDGTPMDFDAARAAISAPGQPYETTPIDVRGVAMDGFANSPRNLAELYAQSLAHADRDFLVYEDDRLTFEQAHARAAALAHWLVEHSGVAVGERVAIAMRNYPEWVLAFMAVTAAGRIAVPMNAWWTEEELTYGLEDSGARLLIADQERCDRIAPRIEALGLRVLVARPASELPAGAEDLGPIFEAHAGAAMPAVDVAPDDDATIMYTSGTTGFPKGAVSTHRAITGAVLAFESNAAAMALRNPDAVPDPTQQGAMLLTVPLFHVTGCHAIFLTSFRPGRKMVLMYEWDARGALALIEAERVTAFTGVPTMTWEMLQVEDFEIPMGMDESEYVQERMENLNQNVIEYVELCRHYIEGRVEDLPADDGIETEAGEEPVSEEAALDSIQDFLTETAHPRAEIVPLQTAGGPTNEIEETVLIEDLSAEPVEMGGELFADTADDVDVEVVEFTAHPDELEQPVQVDGGLDDQGADVVNPDDEPADDDVTDPSLATPRVQEVAFDTSQGARVRDAMRYLKFNYPKYDIERFERILKQPGHSARKLANLYMEKYRAVFDERYEAAAELKTRIEKLEHSLFPSG